MNGEEVHLALRYVTASSATRRWFPQNDESTQALEEVGFLDSVVEDEINELIRRLVKAGFRLKLE